MLEIIGLIWFGKKLSHLAQAKHRSGGWGALGVLGWIGGEVVGALYGVSNAATPGGVYGYALLGAALGALGAFGIVRALPALPPPPPVDFPTARVV
ncbi:MAG: hypothetical protein KBG48_09005 [Kofleriaceae bacterium]|jgi:amino acid transporter|nr:hypothetical protein [Kofleriaceae bacterium]MBP9167513.1 hypothetical protein [Kofleriaceae bacterium]MBP9856594.1 hypothetical protein [Kofleriaceae bacterium]